MATPAAKASSTAQQDATLKSYQKRLREDVRSMLDNFVKIMETIKVDVGGSGTGSDSNLTVGKMQESCYEIHLRAANIQRAAESLMRLIWDIKQFLIINDFPLINDAISLQSQNIIPEQVTGSDIALTHLRDDLTQELFELEDEYYHSLIK